MEWKYILGIAIIAIVVISMGIFPIRVDSRKKGGTIYLAIITLIGTAILLWILRPEKPAPDQPLRGNQNEQRTTDRNP